MALSLGIYGIQRGNLWARGVRRPLATLGCARRGTVEVSTKGQNLEPPKANIPKFAPRLQDQCRPGRCRRLKSESCDGSQHSKFGVRRLAAAPVEVRPPEKGCSR